MKRSLGGLVLLNLLTLTLPINLGEVSISNKDVLNQLAELRSFIDEKRDFTKGAKGLKPVLVQYRNQSEKIDGVVMVKYGEGMIESLLSIFKIVEKILIVIVISLVLVTAFLIVNTIKITIFSRQEEIEIKRLVGASNFSIKQPFVIEGLFIGVPYAIFSSFIRLLFSLKNLTV